MQTSLRDWPAKVFPFLWCIRYETDKFAEWLNLADNSSVWTKLTGKS